MSVPTHPAEGWLSKYECLKMPHKWTSACSQSRRALTEHTGNKLCAKDRETRGNTAAFALFPDQNNIAEGHFYDDRRFPDAFLSFVLFFNVFKHEQSSLDSQPCPRCYEQLLFGPPVKKKHQCVCIVELKSILLLFLLRQLRGLFFFPFSKHARSYRLMAQQQKQRECWRRVDARASIECHYGGAGCQASGQELSWKEEKKIHLAREREGQRVERWRMRSWYSSLFEELDALLTDLFAASMMTVVGLNQKKSTKKQQKNSQVVSRFWKYVTWPAGMRSIVDLHRSAHSCSISFSCSHDNMRGECIIWDSCYLHSPFLFLTNIFLLFSPPCDT